MATDLNIPISRPGNRIRLFIDYWNLQLSLNDRESRVTGQPDPRFKIDWHALPTLIASETAKLVGIPNFTYEGTIVYASYDPTGADLNTRTWLTTWLDRQPGIQVVAKERRPKSIPFCRACRTPMATCPNCSEKVVATVEKGIDTAMTTDLIRLAWEDNYDIGVLASSDSDFVPVVEFLDSRGRKMIQAGLPPSGSYLAKACWASFDLFRLRESFRRE